MLTITGQRLNLSRKFIKIGVTNTGGIVAKQCKAALQVVSAVPNTTRLPSPETKVLLWDNGQEYRDIGINRTEYLHVILSDSRFVNPDDNLFALVSTPDTVKMIGGTRAQDAIGQGAVDFRLTISSETGESIQATLRVHVTANWHDLSMEKV